MMYSPKQLLSSIDNELLSDALSKLLAHAEYYRLDDLAEWIRCELYGYPEHHEYEQIPGELDYRCVQDYAKETPTITVNFRTGVRHLELELIDAQNKGEKEIHSRDKAFPLSYRNADIESLLARIRDQCRSRFARAKREQIKSTEGRTSPSKHVVEKFIAEKLINEIRNARSTYDLKRVVKFCEEINSCYANQNFIAVLLLMRSLLNHVPPIFKKPNFSTFVSQAKRSVKELLSPLEDELRKIADTYAHSMIEHVAHLPSPAVVEPFRPKLEFLIQLVVENATKPT